MKKPLIGITSDYTDDRKQYASPIPYAASVERAGGVPIILPFLDDLDLIPQIIDLVNGLLFSGGDDLDPQPFGESRVDGTQPIDPRRERFERALLAEVEKRRMPTLGICLGSQLMNVYRGGSLYQFLPALDREEPLEHRRLGDWTRRHAVNLVPGTALANRLGEQQIIANTSHKQAVKNLGRGLRVIATSPDGIIEGIEDPNLPMFVGVQWHPERMTDEREHLALFQMLVEHAGEEVK